MKKIASFLLLYIVSFGVFATELETKIQTFYNDLNEGDSVQVRKFLHPSCVINHVDSLNTWSLSVDQFMTVCEKFERDQFEEKIRHITTRAFANGFAYADISFDFYIDEEYDHSGIDHFCWSTRNGVFAVESVFSSVLKKRHESLEVNVASLNEIMNKWHNDVATFKKQDYYDFMSKQFIFLGTDPSERWTKETFVTFCNPYFERKKTWDFKTNWRNFYFSDDRRTAWFEESLQTQMEECRGSGVLEWVNGRWLISHYNLAVVIENEKMKKFIKLRRK